MTVILILIPIPNPHTINSLTYGKIAKKDQKKMKIFKNVKKLYTLNLAAKSCRFGNNSGPTAGMIIGVLVAIASLI